MKKYDKGSVMILFIILISFLLIAIMSITTLVNSRASDVIYETNRDKLYYDSSMALEYVYSALLTQKDDSGNDISSVLERFKSGDKQFQKGYIIIGRSGTDTIHTDVEPIDITLKLDGKKIVDAKVSAVVDERETKNNNGKTDKVKYIKVKATTKKGTTGQIDKKNSRTVTMIIDQSQIDRPKVYDGNINE